MSNDINVNFLRYQGFASLVEYFDEETGVFRRVIIDSKYTREARNKKAIPVPAEQLEYAIPYGIPWELFTHSVTITGEEIAKIMYKNGIYTTEDYQNNPNLVLGAVHEMATPILTLLNSIISNISSKET